METDIGGEAGEVCIHIVSGIKSHIRANPDGDISMVYGGFTEGGNIDIRHRYGNSHKYQPSCNYDGQAHLQPEPDSPVACIVKAYENGKGNEEKEFIQSQINVQKFKNY